MTFEEQPTPYDLVPERCRPCKELGFSIGVLAVFFESTGGSLEALIDDVHKSCSGYQGPSTNRDDLLPEVNESGNIILRFGPKVESEMLKSYCPFFRSFDDELDS